MISSQVINQNQPPGSGQTLHVAGQLLGHLGRHCFRIRAAAGGDTEVGCLDPATHLSKLVGIRLIIGDGAVARQSGHAHAFAPATFAFKDEQPVGRSAGLQTRSLIL